MSASRRLIEQRRIAETRSGEDDPVGVASADVIQQIPAFAFDGVLEFRRGLDAVVQKRLGEILQGIAPGRHIL